MASLQQELRALGGERFNIGGAAITKDSDRLQRTFSRLAAGIGNIRLHLGFFSLSVRQLIVGMSVFGPIISGAIGSLSALAGVVGGALVGGFGLAAGAAMGFGSALLGIGLAVRPLVKELTTAADAAFKYEEQVLKTGKNSEEAKEKLAEYREVVKNLPPDTQKVVAETGKLYRSWAQLTTQLRKPFFDTAGAGVRALSKLMPTFKRETAAAFKATAAAAKDMFAGLGGGEARNILSTTMRNATTSIRPLIAGFGNLATALARFGAASSATLPSVARNFKQWSAGLAKSTDTVRFSAQVNGMMSQLKSFGRFLKSVGDLAITFFGAGADSGAKLLNVMTKTVDRWTSWMRSIEGQETLKKFFADSVVEMRLLARAIGPFIRTFARMSEAMRPISQMVLRVVGAFGMLVEAALRLQIVRDAFTAFLAVRIIGGAVAGVLGLAVALNKVFSITSRGIAALAALRGGLTATAAAARGGAVAMAAFGLSTARAGGTSLLTFIKNSRDLRVALALAAAYGVYKLVQAFANQKDEVDAVTASILGTKRAHKDFTKSLDSLAGASNKVFDSADNVRNAWQRANALAKAGKKDTDAYREAIDSAVTAEKNMYRAQLEREKQARQVLHNRRAEKQAALDAFKQARSEYQFEQKRAAQSRGRGYGDEAKAIMKDAKAAFLPAIRNLRAVQAASAAAAVNFERAKRGLVDLTGPGVQQALAKFQKSFGKSVVKQRIETEVDPRAAVKIAGLANRIKQIGGRGDRRRVKLLLESDASNETVLKRLVKLRNQLGDKKDLSAKFSVKGNPVKTIEQLNKRLKQLENPRRLDVKTEQAQARLQAVNREIRAIMNAREEKEINVTINRTINTKGQAEGGMATYAFEGERADRTRGGRYSRPSFLVGEENRPEYVIATNPAYRRENVQYLRQAATALNVPMVPGFATGGSTGDDIKKPSGNASIPKERKQAKKQAPGLYKFYKERLIPWSENETTATRTRMDRLVTRGEGTLNFEALKSDVARTIKYYENLQTILGFLIASRNDTIQKSTNALKPKNLKGLSKDKKKEKQREAKSKRRDARQQRYDFITEKNVTIPDTLAQLYAQLDDLQDEKEGFTGGGQTEAQGAVALSQARYNLLQQFGSNVVGTGALGGMSFARAVGAPSLAGFTAPAAATAAGSSVGSTTSVRGFGTATGAPAAGKTVSITNNYQEPPPDPHTWSKQVEWEASVL